MTAGSLVRARAREDTTAGPCNEVERLAAQPFSGNTTLHIFHLPDIKRASMNAGPSEEDVARSLQRSLAHYDPHALVG